MIIPDYQSIMLPLLKQCRDGQEWRLRDVYKPLSDEFRLTEEERTRTLASGSIKLNSSYSTRG